MEDYNISKFAIQVGNVIQNESSTGVSLNINFSKAKTEAKIAQLSQEISATLADKPFCLIWTLPIKQEAHGELKQYVDGYIADKKFKGLIPYHIESEVEKLLENESLSIETFSSGNNFYITFSFVGEMKQQIEDSFEMYLENGLEEMSETQDNELTLDCKIDKNFGDMIECLESKELLMGNILNKMHFQVGAKIHTTFFEKLEEFLETIEPELTEHMLFKIIKDFQNFSGEIRFDTPDALPKKYQTNCYKYVTEFLEFVAQKKSDLSEKLLNSIDGTKQRISLTVIGKIFSADLVINAPEILKFFEFLYAAN